MNKLHLTALAATISISFCSAQNKLDLRTKSILAKSSIPETVSDEIASPLSKTTDGTTVLRTVISINDDSAIAELEALGAEISNVIGNVVTCSIPLDRVEQAGEIESIKSITPALKGRILNDKAREMTDVDAVHAGTGLDKAYRGNGVIVGLFDTGLDPNHINFYNSDQTESRVSRVWRYTTNVNTGQMSVSTYDNSSDAKKVSVFETDDPSETHGTHVLGIAAGAYSKGTADYSGMAPDAELAISCGTGYFDEILNGVENIINYAESQGKPCVVNISFGQNIGHHDGTSPFNVALDELAEKVPICISAGNEGDLDIVVKKTLSADDTEMKTFLVPYDGFTQYYAGSYNAQAYGYVEVIGPDETPFTVEVGLYSTIENKIIYRLAAGSGTFNYVGGRYANVDHETNADFTDAYTSASYFGASSAVSPDNNRFYSYVEFELVNKTSSPTVYPVIIVTGTAGNTYEMYSDNITLFSSLGLEDFDAPTRDGTINDMACGKNTIAVGGYCSKISNPPYGGGIVGDVMDYSSWGTLTDGRQLPHICTPGKALVSSMSRYYTSDSYYDPQVMTVTFNDDTYDWTLMEGTSMASPVMAGVAALWLEADPTLTPSEILEIAQETASKDSYVTNGTVAGSPVQWGAGKLEALEGLKEILRRNAGIGSIIVDNEKSPFLINLVETDIYEIFCADSGEMTASIVDMSGRTVASTSGTDTITLDASGCVSGIYLLNVRNAGASETRKIVVR